MVLSFMISNKTGSAASLYSPPIGMNQLPGPICAGGKSIEGNAGETSFWNRVSGFFKATTAVFQRPVEPPEFSETKGTHN